MSSHSPIIVAVFVLLFSTNISFAQNDFSISIEAQYTTRFGKLQEYVRNHNNKANEIQTQLVKAKNALSNAIDLSPSSLILEINSHRVHIRNLINEINKNDGILNLIDDVIKAADNYRPKITSDTSLDDNEKHYLLNSLESSINRHVSYKNKLVNQIKALENLYSRVRTH